VLEAFHSGVLQPTEAGVVLKNHMRPIAASVIALALVFSSCAPAFADSLAAKRAEAASVQSQISVLDQKAEIASEAYNAAHDKYVAITVKVRSAEDHIARLQAYTNTLQTALNTRANSMYRGGGPLDVIAMLLSARTIEDFNSTVELLTRVSEQDASTVGKLKAAKHQAAILHAALVVSQKAAGRQQQAMASNEKAVKTQLAARSTMLAGINASIKQIIAAQEAAAAAAARARAVSWAEQNGGTPPGMDLGGNPPTSSKGAAAVWWAEKALGMPYRWGAAGPNSFDCSGLCMWAYRHVGISLPHYSGAQFESGPHVSRSNLEPGDLVFFGSPIHHVGMYVGGGQFIEAPYTGVNVRISSLGNRSDYAGATRPQ
jgi:cell wall-associated NlpC family hydrolase